MKPAALAKLVQGDCLQIFSDFEDNSVNILLSPKEGQVVLDPFVGSGASCLAAYQSRRHSIGIDANLSHMGFTKQRFEDMLSAPQTANSLR